MIKKKWQGFLISILFAELVGILSSLFSGNVKAEYMSLIKPPFSPPGWIFGVVWPILFAMMGISAYLIYQSDTAKQAKNKALRLYMVQLFVNFTWSIVFFRFSAYWGGVAIVVLLDILVAIMIWVFYRINKTAAYLQIPYLLWILFATYLSIGIAILN